MKKLMTKHWKYTEWEQEHSLYHERDICLPSELTTGYYRMDIACSNCDGKDLIDINKGCTIKQVIKEIKCRECGCVGSMRKANL